MADKKIEDLLTDDSFLRWMRGNANSQEANYWEAWVDGDPRNQRLFEECNTLLNQLNSSEPSPSEPLVELKRFEQAIDQYEEGKKQNNYVYHRSRNYTRRFIAMAAAILFLIASIGVLSIMYYETEDTVPLTVTANQEKKFNTSYGEKINLTLSDGSIIILNSNSELTYSSSQKSGGDINVWLNGEAWFSIPHYTGDRKRLFNVHTKDGRITVLGTQFAVNTYSDNTQAVLEEGRIKVQIEGRVQDSVLTEYTMEPGNLTRFSAGSSRFNLQRVNPVVYTSWINEKLVFDNTPLSAMIQRIENTYGVEVVLEDENLKTEKISGSIKNTNLRILKEALAEALDKAVSQKGQTIRIGSAI